MAFVDFDPKKHSVQQLYQVVCTVIEDYLAASYAAVEVSWEDAVEAPWNYVVWDGSGATVMELLSEERA